MVWYIFNALLFASIVSCESAETPSSTEATVRSEQASDTTGLPGMSGVHSAVVNSVTQVSKYTYLEVTEKSQRKWLAVPKATINVGEVVYYTGGMLMTQFESRELGKKFPEILFLDRVSKDPQGTQLSTSAPVATTATTAADAVPLPAGNSSVHQALPGMGSSKDTVKQTVRVERPSNAYSIAYIIQHSKELNGKTIRVKGKVTKFTGGVMGTNWVHIQDGTEYNKKFEIVVTTLADLTVGATVLFEGKIGVNKDLGFGYFFEVLMEDAAVIQ